MEKFKLYKHKRCLDVAIYPIHIIYLSRQDCYKVKIRWVDISTDRDLGVMDTVRIYRHDFINNWVRV